MVGGATPSPFDRQIDALASDYRIIIPDRTGYGRSGRLRTLAADFHDRAVEETFALIERLGLERPVLWGHSDGAVIAVKMGLQTPAALRGVILEALHCRRDKPASRAFFTAMARDPMMLGERVCGALAAEHGEDYWQTLLELNGRAWLEIARDSSSTRDLYGGRLQEFAVDACIVHGMRDPRTEPGELDEIRAALPHATLALLDEGGHSPHSERAAAEATTAAARAFLAGLTRAP